MNWIRWNPVLMPWPGRRLRSSLPARHAFEQNVAVGEEAEEHAVQQVVLPDDRVADLGNQLAERLAMSLDFLRKLFDLGVRDRGCRRHIVILDSDWQSPTKRQRRSRLEISEQDAQGKETGAGSGWHVNGRPRGPKQYGKLQSPAAGDKSA